MVALNLQHLGVPCRCKIETSDSKSGNQEIGKIRTDNLGIAPRTIFREEPSGATVLGPDFYPSFVWLDCQTYAKIKKNEMDALDPRDLALLYKQHILVEDGLPCPSSFAVKEDNLPVQVLFEVTSNCDCRCLSCYHTPDLNRGEEPLDLLLERIDILCNLGLMVFEVTGGEPFLRNDLPQIFDRITRHRRCYYVVTNGGKLNGSDPEIINSLKKGLGVAVSLDGYGDNHDFVRRNEGLFLRVERSIKLLRTNMIPVNIVTTLGIHNFGDVEPLMSFAKLNTSKLHLRPAIMTGSATANGVISEGIHHKLLKYLDDPNVRNGFLATKRIIPESRHYGCGLRERISVDYSGVLYPCVMDRSNYYMNLRQYTQEALVNQLQEITQKNLSENLSCIDCSINKEKIVCGGFCKFSRSYKGKAKTSCVHMQSRDQL